MKKGVGMVMRTVSVYALIAWTMFSYSQQEPTPILSSSETVELQEETPQQCICTHDESTKRIINHFARIVNHFFDIVKDPRNPKTLEPGLNGVLSGIVSICMEAFKKRKCIKLPVFVQGGMASTLSTFSHRYANICSS
jgi:hypothetical protein